MLVAFVGLTLERASDLRWRVLVIERRFENARCGRGPSSLKPLIVVCREV